MNIFKTLLKPKILLRVTSVRREAGYCILLKALFEKYGFDVFLSCTRNIDFALKFWRPDIVILGNFNGVERVKKICSPTKKGRRSVLAPKHYSWFFQSGKFF